MFRRVWEVGCRWMGEGVFEILISVGILEINREK